MYGSTVIISTVGVKIKYNSMQSNIKTHKDICDESMKKLEL